MWEELNCEDHVSQSNVSTLVYKHATKSWYFSWSVPCCLAQVFLHCYGISTSHAAGYVLKFLLIKNLPQNCSPYFIANVHGIATYNTGIIPSLSSFSFLLTTQNLRMMLVYWRPALDNGLASRTAYKLIVLISLCGERICKTYTRLLTFNISCWIQSTVRF